MLSMNTAEPPEACCGIGPGLGTAGGVPGEQSILWFFLLHPPVLEEEQQ